MQGLFIRELESRDLGDCDALRKAVLWNQTPQDWARFFLLSPGGCFGAEWNHKFVGTVTTVHYGGTVGWVGMLIVHPEYRGRGIGAALLQRAIYYLQGQKIPLIGLDATPEGAPLYTRFGFSPDFGIRRWERTPSAVSTSTHSGVRRATSKDLPVLVQWDQTAFGVARSDLLKLIVRSGRNTVVFEDAGAVRGFGVLRPGSRADYLGPVIAHNLSVAEALVSALLDGEQKAVFWDVPERVGSELALKLGFTVQRQLVRMSLGETRLSASLENYWGLLDPSCG